jgi:UDP-glucuronate decarboxylase
MTTEKGVTGPMNLGNPIEYTILEIAEIVIDQVGSKSKIIFETLPDDDPKQRQPDISFAKSELNWEPKTQLKEGIDKTIQYFDQILSNNVNG